MIIAFLIIITILGLAVYFLGPKDFFRKDLWEILISRTSFSLVLSVILLGLSFIKIFHFNSDSSHSAGKNIIDIILWVPMAIPFLLGFTESNELAIAAILVELILITLVIRLLIPKSWIEKWRKSVTKD